MKLSYEENFKSRRADGRFTSTLAALAPKHLACNEGEGRRMAFGK